MQSAPIPDWEAIAEQQLQRMHVIKHLVQRELREVAREKAKRAMASAGTSAAQQVA